MVRRWGGWYWRLGLASWLGMGGAITSLGDCTLAQIAPDNTLGSESSKVTSTGSVDQIDGGSTRGANLFHSFEQFSVPTKGTAYFNNASAIQNIISRVTGGSISNIDGLIQANGTANLFLLNPNGIIFGPNATLDIGGSFVGSTASSLNFADGKQFSATAPQTTPLLTVSVPLGLQYGSNAGSVQVQRSPLRVQTGQTLALVGGDVSVEGGEFGVLSAPGGRIELGGLTGAGTVKIEGQQSEGAFGLTKLRFPDEIERADVLLTNLAYVNVAASGGGSIAINARNIDTSGESILRGGLETDSGFLGATAGDITLNATGAIAIKNGGGISNNVETGAVGNGGSINITAGSLSVTDDAQLQSVTFGQGDAGSVTINARDTVSFDGGSAFSTVESRAVGKGGGINITTGALSLTNGAQLAASTRGQGDAGSVNINARDTVSFDGVSSNEYLYPSAALSTVQPEAVGNGGDITIKAGSLSINDRAGLYSSTYGQGNAGNVLVRVDNAVSFTKESEIRGGVEAGGVGKSGDIVIQARSLFVTNGSQIGALVLRQARGLPGGQGRGGNIQVNASDSVTLSGIGSTGFSSGLIALTEKEASGSAGNIAISTSNFRVADGAIVVASTFNPSDGGNITIKAKTFEAVTGGQVLTNARSSGNAGNIKLNVTDSITLSGSDPNFDARLARIEQRLQSPEETDEVSDVVGNEGAASGLFANTGPNSKGQGGDLWITTGQLMIRDGAQVNVSSQGTGDAGKLQVQARSIQLDNQAALSAQTTSGNGGGIILQAQDLLLLRRNSNISTTAGTKQAGGDGGNLEIDTPFLVTVPSENSDLTANAFRGNGGNIKITAQGIFGTQFRDHLTPESEITATSEFGVDGVVEINTPDVEPSQGLTTLPAELVDASVLIASSACGAAGRQRQSEFFVTGRGGLPLRPGDAAPSPYPTGSVRSIPSSSQSSETPRSPVSGNEPSTNPTSSEPPPLVEAQGWVINDKGEVVLTAQATTATPHNPWINPATCRSSNFHQQPLALVTR